MAKDLKDITAMLFQMFANHKVEKETGARQYRMSNREMNSKELGNSFPKRDASDKYLTREIPTKRLSDGKTLTTIQ
jgi:hypothetical protein